jgi:hypothetical protein
VYGVSQKSGVVGMGVHVPSASLTSGVSSFSAIEEEIEA